MSSSQNQPLKIPALVGLAFAVVGALISGLLVCKHLGVCHTPMGCTLASGVDGCKALGESKHSMLFGVPIAIFGLFYYLMMSLVMFQALRATAERIKGTVNLVLSFAIFGLMVDLALGYKNFFVLLHPCKLCAYTYVMQVGIAVSAAWMFVASGKDLGGSGELAAAAKGAVVPVALAAIGTGLTAIVLVMGVGKADPQASSKTDLSLPYPATQTKTRLMEFRALKKVPLSSAGLTQVEGDPKAYIIIHKFADFQCGHCYNAGLILRSALQRWPGRIRVYYRHFPLDPACNRAIKGKSRGGYSCNGAQAALCAARQNMFAKVYHGVFDFQRQRIPIEAGSLKALVSKLGGDWSSMLACMTSGATSAAIHRDVVAAQKLNIQSTPTITVNGHLLPAGTPGVASFFGILDALVYEKEGQPAYDEMIKRMAALKKSGRLMIPGGDQHGHGDDHSGHSH